MWWYILIELYSFGIIKGSILKVVALLLQKYNWNKSKSNKIALRLNEASKIEVKILKIK